MYIMSSSLFKVMLTSSFLICAPVLSAELAPIKLQAQKMSDEFNHYYQVQSNIEDFRINQLTHHYIVGHGLTFMIDTNIDELMTRSSLDLSEPSLGKQVEPNHYVHSSAAKSPKQQLNDLHMQARNLAHQEFSLQKQISSMQSSSLNSNNEAQKQSIDNKIRSNQDKLKNIIFEKSKVANEIASFSSAVEHLDTQASKVSRAYLYNTLVNQSFQLLCQKSQVLENLAQSDKLTLIFKGLGQADAISYQDEIVTVERELVEQCSYGEISPQQLRQQSRSYQY